MRRVRALFRGEASTALLLVGAGGALQVATAVAGLLVARSMTPERYGEVAYFFSVFGVIVMMGSLGLTTQVTTQVTTDIARFVGLDPRRWSGESIQTLVVVRLGTAGLVLGLSAVVAAFDPIAAAAGVAGCVVLLSTFVVGIAQGLGRARLVAGLQVGQALVYLLCVATWARSSPDHVFVAVVISNGAALLASCAVCRDALAPLWAMPLSSALQSRWKAVCSACGGVYLLTLLLAPFGALAPLALGTALRFYDASTISVTLSLTLLPSTVLALAISTHYYPRLCRLVADDSAGPIRGAEASPGAIVASRTGAAALFDVCSRPYLALGVAAATTLSLFAPATIDAAYSPTYHASSWPVTVASPCALFLVMGQLAVWTLWGHGKRRWALAGAAAQLAFLAAFVAVAMARPALSLTWLGAGHAAAAAIGVVVWTVGLGRVGRHYTWRMGRIATATAATLPVEWCVSLLGRPSHDHLASLLQVAAAFCLGLAIAATILVLDRASWRRHLGRWRWAPNVIAMLRSKEASRV